MRKKCMEGEGKRGVRGGGKGRGEGKIKTEFDWLIIYTY